MLLSDVTLDIRECVEKLTAECSVKKNHMLKIFTQNLIDTRNYTNFC